MLPALEMENKEGISPGDLMKFLEGFKMSIEAKIAENKECIGGIDKDIKDIDKDIKDIDKKMDERLNKIDEEVGKINNEVGKVNDKIIENERKSIAATLRMDRRLTKLEEEMRKSSILSRKSEELRKQEKMQKILQKNRNEEDPMLVEDFTEDRSVGQGCGTGVWDRGVGQGQGNVTEEWWDKGVVGQGSGENRVEDSGVGQGCGTREWDRGGVGQGRGEDRMENRGVKNVRNDKIVEEPSGTFDLCSSGGTFRSTWAKGIQAELAKAAEAVKELKGTRREDEREEEKKEEEKTAEEEKRKRDDDSNWRRRRENGSKYTPEAWEERIDEEPTLMDKLMRRKETKIRKPMVIKEWFGDDSTDSSDDSEAEYTGWNMVERKKKVEEKKKRQRKRKEERKHNCAVRAASMVSLGPVSIASIEFFMRDNKTFEEAKVCAVKELLKFDLNYDEEELKELQIMETRISKRGDNIINVAFANEEEVRGIFMKKAELRNDNITLRNYIPPSFHDRFMHLNAICTEKRKAEPGLKTQLRFGKRDIEVFVKTRGEEGGFKKVKLEDFTDVSGIPEYNHEIRWKRYVDKLPRKATSHREENREKPSTRRENDRRQEGGVTTQPNTGKEQNKSPANSGTMVRANSNSVVSEKKRRKRLNADSSNEEETEEDRENDDMEEDREDILGL